MINAQAGSVTVAPCRSGAVVALALWPAADGEGDGA